MGVKLLTEHHLKFLSLKGGCTALSEPTLVKMPHCSKSCVAAHISSKTALVMCLEGSESVNDLHDTTKIIEGKVLDHVQIFRCEMTYDLDLINKTLSHVTAPGDIFK